MSDCEMQCGSSCTGYEFSVADESPGYFGYEGLVGDCGHDVDTDSSLWNTDIDSCAEACDARSDCKGFTWNEINSVCIFKKEKVPTAWPLV
eukprot:TRINITY_DN1597_c0_g1_i1.p2 TRINITY_DN1597_c0_g1~~TRINITY_DN1597_c0_g1_i1.p2  ORF type:complete len:91 (+),score=25.97 TRINITY_DN1597_c0_g1_i1:627-899(+)